MRINDLEADTLELHDRLVGHDTLDRKRRIDGYLTEKFIEAGVVDLVQKSVSIEIPDFKQAIRVPYAYQNGRFNLISPVQFEPNPEALFAKTGPSAIEGQVLYDKRHPTYGELRLVVVAKFDAQVENAAREFVRNTFESHRVALYTFEDLGPLVDDIRRSATIHQMEHLG